MRKQDDHIVISVESRKGGVGKTTIVLNLAKLLMHRYHVLVLDVDVTGTSINAIQDTSVWQKSVSLLKDEMGKCINLLQLFKDQYLLGQYNLRFSNQNNEAGISVYSDMVNVMGSELYDAEGSMLYDPSIVFDEIHDFWLIDMIRMIAQSFSGAFSDKKKSIIILDNSPGYVGLGKSIHDMLTDMGPARGKFLSVSSLDMQDINSCLKAIKNIHTITQSKEKGAAFFHGNLDLAFLKSGSMEQRTFDRLALGDEGLSYYSNAEVPASRIEQYQAIVFNKVPLNVKSGRLVYKYDQQGQEELANVFSSLCEGNLCHFMIPYDESIHGQFFRQNLSLSKPVDKINFDGLLKMLASLNNRAGKLEGYNKEDNWRKIAYSLNRINRDLERLPESLKEVGLFDQANHINPLWYPSSVFRDLFTCLQQMELISNERVFYFPFFLPKSQRFEELLDLSPLSNHPQIVRAVKVVLVVLEVFLKQSVEGLPKACSYVERILEKCLYKEGIIRPGGLNGTSIMEFVHYEKNGNNSPDYLFMLSFLEAVVRVIDLPSDIMAICDMLYLFVSEYNNSTIQTDANVAWVLDKKILTKEINLAQSSEMVRKEIAESDYMAVVRQVVSPIISRWSL